MGNAVAMNLVATMMEARFANSNAFVKSSSNLSGQSFTQILDSSVSNYKTSTGNTSNSYENSSSLNRDDISEQSLESSSYDTDNYNQTVNKTNKRIEELKNQSQTDNVEEITSEEAPEVLSQEIKSTDSEELTGEELTGEEEAMSEMAAILGITIQEVESLLTEMGINLEDLQEPDQLKLFMINAMELENEFELLTVENAVSMLNDAEEVVEKYLQTEGNKLDVDMSQNNTEGESIEFLVSEDQTEYTQASTENNSNDSNNNTSSEDTGKSTLTTTNASGEATTDKTASNVTFDQALSQVVTQKTETIVLNGKVQTIYTEVTGKDVFNQIVTGMKVQVTENKSSLLLQLNPENLGKIAINLTKENGIVSGSFLAESEAVKEIIEKNLPQLKQQLEAQGINIDKIEISVGNTDSFFTGEDNQSETGGQNSNNKQFKSTFGAVNGNFTDAIEEEAIKTASLQSDNSSIEFQA